MLRKALLAFGDEGLPQRIHVVVFETGYLEVSPGRGLDRLLLRLEEGGLQVIGVPALFHLIAGNALLGSHFFGMQ